MKAKIMEVLEELGQVLGKGNREEFLWFDVDTKPLNKEKYEEIEKKLREKGLFAKVINSSSALNKATGKEVQRIWLVAFDSEEKLKTWQKDFEERKKRDHRYIGEQLDIFHIEEEIIGPGLPLLHPKGMKIRLGLIDYIREINNKFLNAEEIWTPHIAKAVLWKMSGHYAHYRDKMFIWNQEGEEWGIKAMNCPMHIQIYRFKPRSYRELPIRYAEFATVYRKEQSGELHGLARVYSLTQDDHHFFVRPDQIEEEVKKILEAVVKVYKTFGFEFKANLSTRPDDYMGSLDIWNKAEDSLKKALERAGLEYEVKEKEGAFYGPKIDFDVKDSMGRWWQLATIQLDFFMPENFKLSYITADQKQERPVIIHFAILGSIERFMAMLIEHTKGKMPFWLAPVQVRILPVSEKNMKYAEGILEKLKEMNIRAEIDIEGTLSKRIRNAITEKVATVAIVGDKEEKNKEINIRDLGNMRLEEFFERVKNANKERLEHI